MATNVCTKEAGAAILTATGVDPKYPPENILESSNTFWLSTGLFPQEIIVSLANLTTVSEFKLVSKYISQATILVADKAQPIGFEEVATFNTSSPESKQTLTQTVTPPAPARYVKIRIDKGSDDLCGIWQFVVNGSA